MSSSMIRRRNLNQVRAFHGHCGRDHTVSSRFDQKHLIRKHALGHRTTVLAKEIEPESIRFGEETRIMHKNNYCSIAIAVATILNPLLRWRWIDSSRFDQKRLIRKHALGHRTTVLAKEIEPESIRFGEETRIRKLTNHDMSWYSINIWRFCSELCWHVKYSKNHRSLSQGGTGIISRGETHRISQNKSCSYSGGMKRRLIVAIALIGDPKLVILDEP
ncbi:unnamed protein product [Camellia sinensis]